MALHRETDSSIQGSEVITHKSIDCKSYTRKEVDGYNIKIINTYLKKKFNGNYSQIFGEYYESNIKS